MKRRTNKPKCWVKDCDEDAFVNKQGVLHFRCEVHHKRDTRIHLGHTSIGGKRKLGK